MNDRTLWGLMKEQHFCHRIILQTSRVLFATVTVLLLISSTLSNAAVNNGNAFIAHRDIAYVAGSSDIQQSLDIYLPADASTLINAPVHVYVHGGAWVAGDKGNITVEQIQAYTDQGIILVSLNYRLGPENKYPANIQDIVSASEWIQQNIGSYGGDVENMVLSGHSAGAHLVALFGVGTPDAMSAASGDVFHTIAPVDTASFDLTRPAEGKGALLVNLQRRRVFGNDPDVLERASPLSQIESGANYSVFDLYVTRERDYGVTETRRFRRELLASAYEVTIKIIDELSHEEMREAMFDPDHAIYRRIVKHLR